MNNFTKEGHIYWVVISADAPFRQNVEEIEDIYVRNSNNQMLPLSVLMTKKPILGADNISRFNLFKNVSISGILLENVSTGDGIAAMQNIADQTLPAGYQIVWSGVTLQEVEAGDWLSISFCRRSSSPIHFLSHSTKAGPCRCP